MGATIELEITTVKICCVFDKHKRHILESYNARKNRFLFKQPFIAG